MSYGLLLTLHLLAAIAFVCTVLGGAEHLGKTWSDLRKRRFRAMVDVGRFRPRTDLLLNPCGISQPPVMRRAASRGFRRG